MSKAATTTGVTHYEIQKQRRAKVLEEWRQYRTTLVRAADVQLVDTPTRRMRRGVYMGADGPRKTKVLDGTLHEIPAATTSTTAFIAAWNCASTCGVSSMNFQPMD